MSTLTREEKIKLMKESLDRINSIPESEKQQIPQELLHRMQSEAEFNESITPEKKKIMQEILNTEERT